MSAHPEDSLRATETGRAGEWEPVVVPPATVRPLRGEVLRPGQPAEQLAFAGDEEPETLHAAVLLDGDVVGIATVMREPCPRIERAHAWRLRGMATRPDVRGRGIGAALLGRCEAHVRDQGGRLLWCNARVGACRFYERAGYTVAGERFELPQIGPHYLMSKEISQAVATATGTC